MKNNMNSKERNLYLEELAEARQEIRDYEDTLNNDKEALANAVRWVSQSEKNLELAKKRLQILKNKNHGM